MSFRQLTEGDCGQVNPLAQLATHVTQDRAHQDAVSNECRNENLMLPNTFNMNELMVQMQGLQSLPGPSSNDVIWSGNNIQTGMQSFEFLPAGPSYRDNFFLPREPYNMNVAGNQVPAFFPSEPEYLPHNWASFNMEFEPTTQELDESEAEVKSASLQYFSRTELTSAEAEAFQRVQKQLLEEKDVVYLHYDGVFVEDVYGVSNLGIELNDFEYYQNFVENYVLARSTREYQKYRPTLKGTPLIAISIEEKSKSVTIRYDKFEYEISDKRCLFREDLSRILFNYLENAEEYAHAINVANAVVFDDDLVFSLTDLYLHEHCFYQACQTLFTWLKNDPSYGDIIPPNFTMENRTDTAVDKKLLRALQKMFIKAAQRSPFVPDIRVQTALGKLCQMDQDHEKATDCYRTILKNPLNQSQKKTSRALMSLGNSLALANKPKAATFTFSLLRNEALFVAKATTNMGLMHLYRRNYAVAFKYLFEVIKNHLEGCEAFRGIELESSWAKLRLCCELMRRDDLCEAIDNRDFSKINKVAFQK